MTEKKLSALREPLTKARLHAEIAEMTGLSRKDVAAVFDALQDVMCRHLKKRSVGQFTLPGLVKFTVATKKATKARMVISPFDGKETLYKAKPARRVVKVKALKALHDLAESS